MQGWWRAEGNAGRIAVILKRAQEARNGLGAVRVFLR
jgi:hypothetical protein